MVFFKLPVNNMRHFTTKIMVGLPGFEPESIEPKSTSLDQASRQPLFFLEEALLSDLFIPIGSKSTELGQTRSYHFNFSE